jgi:hypothetical protein
MKSFTIRLDSETHNLLEELAKINNTSLNSAVVTLIKNSNNNNNNKAPTSHGTLVRKIVITREEYVVEKD